MIHSRPGYAPRKVDDEVAALNADMIPALHRGAKPTSSPLKTNLDDRTLAAHAKMLDAQMALAKAQAEAEAAKIGPEVLVNPMPSPAPLVLEPGK